MFLSRRNKLIMTSFGLTYFNFDLNYMSLELDVMAPK